jgi:hypothetical protein
MAVKPGESAVNPQILMSQLLFGKQLTYCLSGVAWLGVADHMRSTPMPIETIAAMTGAHAPSLYRVMRALAAMGVFREEPGKRFALTQAGELLKSDASGSVRYFAMMFGDEWTTRAYEHFVECLRTGQDGVSQAYGKHVFDVLADRPDLSDTFQAAMTSGSTMAGKAVTAAYDFSGIERLADVGGGHGALLAAILRLSRHAGRAVRPRRDRGRRAGGSVCRLRGTHRNRRRQLLRARARRLRRLHHEAHHPRLERRALPDHPAADA